MKEAANVVRIFGVPPSVVRFPLRRRLRYFCRYAWRYLRSGNEEWLDVAALALTAPSEFTVLVRAWTVGMDTAMREITLRLAPGILRLGKAMEAVGAAVEGKP